MGKKSKKILNNWDLTVEEQNQRAEELYQYEIGNIQYDSTGNNKPKGKLNQNGFTDGLEKLIVSDMMKLNGVASSPAPTKTNMERVMNRPTCTTRDVEPSKRYVMDLSACRKIVFDTRYADELYKIVINDDISPTSISLALALDQDLAVSLDADDVYDKILTLYSFIISQKYPTAIYSEFEFENNYDFSRVVDGLYDEAKFRFIKSHGYVLCYAIDDTSVQKFKQIMEDEEYDTTETLKTYLSIAESCRSVMQSFFPEDAWFIEELYNSNYNQKELFSLLFLSDESTKVVLKNEQPRKGIDGVEPEDCETIVRGGGRLITFLTGVEEDDDDEDMENELAQVLKEINTVDLDGPDPDIDLEDVLEDDDDDDDYSDDDIDVFEVEETKVVAETPQGVNIKESVTVSTENPKEVIASLDAEINDLLSDDMEVIEEKSITKLKTTIDEDNFKIPVVRRK